MSARAFHPVETMAQEKHINQKPQILMITISTNQNFKEWLNIRLFGKVVDNAKSRLEQITYGKQTMY